MAPRGPGRAGRVALAACMLYGCEYVAGVEERTLAKDAGGAGLDAAVCESAGLVAWPDSSTAFCASGGAPVSCDGATEPRGQDGLYRADVPTYTKVSLAKGLYAVRDEVTGLLWSKDGSDVRSWDAARVSCEALGDGFRLPSRMELSTLVDYGRTNPAIDSAFLTPTANNDLFWTSSGPSSDAAWAVGFAEGIATLLPRTGGARSRCVMGTALSSCLTKEDEGGTVSDARAGLVWQKQPSASAVPWVDALSSCEALVLAGKDDWRLPSAKEIGSLVVGDGPGAALDPVLFPDGVGRFWTSTPSPVQPDQAFFLDGASGVLQRQSATLMARVRCVR